MSGSAVQGVGNGETGVHVAVACGRGVLVGCELDERGVFVAVGRWGGREGDACRRR